jgi:hypothetical protein
MQYLLLNARRQVEQIHDLRHARLCDVAEACEFGAVGKGCPTVDGALVKLANEVEEGLLDKPGAVIAWAFFAAVILRHHLAGDPVHVTFAKAGRHGCDHAWARLICIDPLVVITSSFQTRFARGASESGDNFASIVAKAISKHEEDNDWDTSRQFEAAMHDLVRVEGAKPLRYEDVFGLCEKYGGSAFGGHISLRAEASKIRK